MARATLEERLSRAWDGHSDMGDPIVEQALKGGKFSFGPIKTNFPLPAGVTAPLVALGDQMGDAWRGIAQFLKQQGVANVIDEDVQNRNEDIIRALYDDQSYGTLAKGGAVVGAISEPLGLLIPAAKAKSAYGALMYSAGVGSLYGSSLYVDDQESRMANAIAGGIGMGVFGALAHKFFRAQVGAQIDDRLAEVGRDTLEGSFRRVAPKEQQSALRQQIAVSDKALDLKPKPKKTKQIAQDNMLDLEARAAIRGPRAGVMSGARQVVDSWMQPLYNNVKKYNDVVAAGLRKVDFNTHSMQKSWTDQIKPFQEFMDTLPMESREALHRLLLNQGLSKGVIQEASKLGGAPAVDAFVGAQKVLDDVMKHYEGVGYKIKKRSDYFPRSVADLESLAENHASIIDSAMASVGKGKNLSARDEARIMERLLTFDPRFSATSGALKGRKIPEVTDEQMQYYHDPVSALYYYVNTAAEDVANRKFFQSFGHKPPSKKGLDVTGSDIDKSIDSLVTSLKKTLPNWKDRNDLVKLLRSRFDADVHNTANWIRSIKNLSYAGTLGNFWSAMTQVGDIVFAFHKYGIGETVQSILGKNISTKEALGIDKAMQELNEAGRSFTAKVADWAFKYGGFDAVDRFGKNVNINASLRLNRKNALKHPDKFRAKWNKVFGEDTDTVMAELRQLKMTKNEKMSDNLKLMLWNDLADTQPIGLSEMPKKYLDMPNGRMFYAYKTFTLKQMNYMREVLRRGGGSPTKRAADLTYFASLFVVSNAGVDYVKDFLLGKDIDFEDNVLDNIAGILGTNKYAVDKSRGLGSLLMEGFKPVPWTQGAAVVDTAGQALMGEVDVPNMLEKLPVAGKPYKALREWGYAD